VDAAVVVALVVDAVVDTVVDAVVDAVVAAVAEAAVGTVGGARATSPAPTTAPAAMRANFGFCIPVLPLSKDFVDDRAYFVRRPVLTCPVLAAECCPVSVSGHRTTAHGQWAQRSPTKWGGDASS